MNFTSITSAIRAKDSTHGKLATPDAGSAQANKPMLINFTSAQQNCMRARARAPNGGGNWGGMGSRDHHQSYEGRMDSHPRAPRYPPSRRSGPRGDSSRDSGSSSLPTKSRALYFGSLPDSAGLKELVALVEVSSAILPAQGIAI